jgi:hypothetical protein
MPFKFENFLWPVAGSLTRIIHANIGTLYHLYLLLAGALSIT